MEAPVESNGTENTPTPVDESQARQIGEFFTTFGPGSDRARQEPKNQNQDQGSDEGSEDLIGDEISDPTADAPSPERGSEDQEAGGEGTSHTEGGEQSAIEKELAELKEQFSALAARLTQPTQEAEPEPEPQPRIEADPASFLSDDEIEEFTVDPGKTLRTLAARIYARAREDTLRDLPQVVERAAERQTTLTEARTNFWNKNSDLLQKAQENRGVAQLIRLTANEIQSQNPSWDMAKIFEETGKQVRQSIGLSEQARQIEQNTQTKRPNQPRKPRTSSSRAAGSEDTRTMEQKQIDAMLESVG